MSGILCEGIINFTLKVHVDCQLESTAKLDCNGGVMDFCLESGGYQKVWGEKPVLRNSRNGGGGGGGGVSMQNRIFYSHFNHSLMGA